MSSPALGIPPPRPRRVVTSHFTEASPDNATRSRTALQMSPRPSASPRETSSGRSVPPLIFEYCVSAPGPLLPPPGGDAAVALSGAPQSKVTKLLSDGRLHPSRLKSSLIKCRSSPTLAPLSTLGRVLLRSPVEVARLLNVRVWAQERMRIRELLTMLDDGHGLGDKAILADGLWQITQRESVWPPLNISVVEIQGLLDALPSAELLTSSEDGVQSACNHSEDGGALASGSADFVPDGGIDDAAHDADSSAPELGRAIIEPEHDALIRHVIRHASRSVAAHELLRALARGNVPPPATPALQSLKEDGRPARSHLRNRPTLSYMPTMAIVWPQAKTYSGDMLVEKLQECLIRSGARTIDMLRQWDTDATNSVDEKEFGAALKAAGCPADKHDLHALFERLDVDGDGELAPEMLRVIRHSDCLPHCMQVSSPSSRCTA